MAGVIINANPARLKHSAMIRPSVRLSRAPATQQGGNLGGKSAKTQQKPLNQSISIDKRSLVLNCLYDCIYFRGFFGVFFFSILGGYFAAGFCWSIDSGWRMWLFSARMVTYCPRRSVSLLLSSTVYQSRCGINQPVNFLLASITTAKRKHSKANRQQQQK